jgi:hypothetical protein
VVVVSEVTVVAEVAVVPGAVVGDDEAEVGVAGLPPHAAATRSVDIQTATRGMGIRRDDSQGLVAWPVGDTVAACGSGTKP